MVVALVFRIEEEEEVVGGLLTCTLVPVIQASPSSSQALHLAKATCLDRGAGGTPLNMMNKGSWEGQSHC